MAKLTEEEKKAICWDNGFTRVVETHSGEVHVYKGNRRAFFARSADDARKKCDIKRCLDEIEENEREYYHYLKVKRLVKKEMRRKK